MAVPPIAITSIREDLQRVDADIRALSRQAAPARIPTRYPGRSPRDQDFEALVHQRDRVVTKLDALRLTPARHHERLYRELETAWSELQQTWSRVRLRRLTFARS